MFQQKEPDIEKLKRTGKVKKLIKALKYESPVRYNPNMRRSPSSDAYFKYEAYKDTVYVRTNAANALGEIGTEVVIEPLIEFTRKAYVDYNNKKNVDINLRWRPYEAGKKALASVRGEPAVSKLISVVARRETEHDPCILSAILAALGCSQDMRAVQPLIDIINSRINDNVCASAAEALAALGAKSAIEPVIRYYRSVQGKFTLSNKLKIINALIKLGDISLLIPIMTGREENPEQNFNKEDILKLRDTAAKGLKDMGWRPGKDEAGAAYCILNKEWDMCMEIGSPAVETLIRRLQETDNHNDSEHIAWVLGNIGDERAAAPLLSILNREYRPLYTEEQDGEIYSAGYAEINEHRKRFYSLESTVANALFKLSESAGVKPEIKESIRAALAEKDLIQGA